MRPALPLAIALGLSFPAQALAGQQGQSATAAGASQAPATAVSQSPDAKQNSTRSGTQQKGSAVPPAATKRHHTPAPSPPGTPRKIVVREGGADEPAEQIVPGMSPGEAARQRQDAERWLSSADRQLDQLTDRKLATQQQETVSQIHNYMKGARSALDEGDVRRASTLAEKAYLLSDDLVKH